MCEGTVGTEGGTGRSRYRILLGLVPLALMLFALAPPAQADPEFQNNCRIQLTGEEGANSAEFTFDCAEDEIDTADLTVNKPPALFGPPAEGEEGAFFLCVPLAGPDAATCQTNEGAAEGERVTVPINAQDVCGTEDNEPLTINALLFDGDTEVADFVEHEIQCTQAPDDGDGDGDGDGTGGGDDDGTTPSGGVDSGAGGTASGAPGGALLPVGLGLGLVATLGFGALALTRRRT